MDNNIDIEVYEIGSKYKKLNCDMISFIARKVEQEQEQIDYLRDLIKNNMDHPYIKACSAVIVEAQAAGRHEFTDNIVGKLNFLLKNSYHLYEMRDKSEEECKREIASAFRLQRRDPNELEEKIQKRRGCPEVLLKELDIVEDFIPMRVEEVFQLKSMYPNSPRIGGPDNELTTALDVSLRCDFEDTEYFPWVSPDTSLEMCLNAYKATTVPWNNIHNSGAEFSSSAFACGGYNHGDHMLANAGAVSDLYHYLNANFQLNQDLIQEGQRTMDEYHDVFLGNGDEERLRQEAISDSIQALTSRFDFDDRYELTDGCLIISGNFNEDGTMVKSDPIDVMQFTEQKGNEIIKEAIDYSVRSAEYELLIEKEC